MDERTDMVERVDGVPQGVRGKETEETALQADAAEEKMGLLIDFVSVFYRMLGISALVCRHGKVVALFCASSAGETLNDFFEGLMLDLVHECKESTVGDFTAGGFLPYGISYDGEGDVAVFLGPARTDGITIAQLKKFFGNTEIFAAFRDELYQYLVMLPVLNAVRFRGIFSLIDMFLNRRPFDLALPESKNDFAQGIEREELDFLELQAESDKRRDSFYESEKRILFYVKNGMTEQVEDILWHAPLHVSVNDNDSMRRAKDSVIVGIGLASRAAMNAGANSVLCLHMQQLFIDKVESCYSIDQLSRLRYEALSYFTRKVAQLQTRNITNPVVLRVVQYIIENVEQQITCREISEVCHINRSYVSTCFKKEMGMGIVDYANLQKVIRAKQMLRFTDKSIVEIAYSLSFSSQSYFTKVFKDIVGMTPVEYRES